MTEHTDNDILIDAPLNIVWTLTNELDLWPSLFTEYETVEILHRDGDTVRFRLTTCPDADGRTWRWVSEREADPATRTVRARRIENGVFKYMYLFWEYQDTPDGVRMRWVQDFEMKPDAPFDDAGMARRLNRTSRVQMDNIKEWIEKAVSQIDHQARP